MALGDTSLLFRIKGDATDAVRALNQTQREANDLTGATSKLSGGLASLGGPAAIATAGMAALGTGVVAAAGALFGLAKSAADYGGAIFDASEKTGASTDSLQALKFAAEQSGSSFEGVTNGGSSKEVRHHFPRNRHGTCSGNIYHCRNDKLDRTGCRCGRVIQRSHRRDITRNQIL
jgi:hypothetical protein